MNCLVVLACVTLNAFCACLEVSFLSASTKELQVLATQGHARAQIALLCKHNPERTIAALQMIMTFISMLSGSLGGADLSARLSPYLTQNMNWSSSTSETVALLLVALPLTLFTVVFGEIIPKTIALRFPLPILLAGAAFLGLFDKLASPFTNTITRITNKIFCQFNTSNKLIVDDLTTDNTFPDNLTNITIHKSLQCARLRGRKSKILTVSVFETQDSNSLNEGLLA